MSQVEQVQNLARAVADKAAKDQNFLEELMLVDDFINKELKIIDDGTISDEYLGKLNKWLDKAWQSYRALFSKKTKKKEFM